MRKTPNLDYLERHYSAMLDRSLSRADDELATSIVKLIYAIKKDMNVRDKFPDGMTCDDFDDIVDGIVTIKLHDAISTMEIVKSFGLVIREHETNTNQAYAAFQVVPDGYQADGLVVGYGPTPRTAVLDFWNKFNDGENDAG